jgi:adenosylcobinamide amidohydrolase
MSEIKQQQRRYGERAFALATLTLALAACSSMVPSPLVISGSWTGTGSDAGAVQWTLTQDNSTFSGTVTVLGPNNSCAHLLGRQELETVRL